MFFTIFSTSVDVLQISSKIFYTLYSIFYFFKSFNLRKNGESKHRNGDISVFVFRLVYYAIYLGYRTFLISINTSLVCMPVEMNWS